MRHAIIQKILLIDFVPLLLGVFSLFFSHAFAATESIRIIREDCTGYSDCYTSLFAWEAAEQRDLVTANEIAVARIEGTWTNPDTTAVTIDGWTTGVDNYIRIYTTTEARHAGVWDTNKYRLEPTDANSLVVNEDYVRVDGLQVRILNTTTQRKEFSSGNNQNGVVTLSNSIISGSGVNSVGISVNNVQVGGVILYNNIIYNTQNQFFGGVRYNGTGTLRAYNNTIIDSYYGFRRSNGTIIAKNNIVINSVSSAYLSDNSVWGTGSDYNISSDGTSTNGANDKINQTVLFSDDLNSNYHLSSLDTSALDAGIDLSGDLDLSFLTDIDGDTRSGTWDIGADEYIVADTTPPVRSTGSPSGLFPHGTTSTTLSLVTNESATCKYGTTPNTAYASISSTFTTTGSTSHSTSVLTINGQSYTYYVRCSDDAGNANTDDYSISFAIDNPPPDRVVVDIIAPTTPVNAHAVAISPSRIVFSWDASSDERGVIGYYVFRNGEQISTTHNTTYTDINLNPSTTYTYTVSAYDTALNFSQKSAETSATTQNLVEIIQSSVFSEPPPPPVPIRPFYTFLSGHLISYGMKNSTDIRELQKILQYEGFLPNTPFALDGIFLGATKNAVIKFQEKYDLTPLDGKVGPLTKKKLNELYGSSPPPVFTETAQLFRDLTVGSSGDDVKKLQQLLNTDIDTLVASSGAGSPGNETTYFGPATKAAVIKYQQKYHINPPQGYVGPLTRGKLEGR